MNRVHMTTLTQGFQIGHLVPQLDCTLGACLQWEAQATGRFYIPLV